MDRVTSFGTAGGRADAVLALVEDPPRREIVLQRLEPSSARLRTAVKFLALDA